MGETTNALINRRQFITAASAAATGFLGGVSLLHCQEREERSQITDAQITLAGMGLQQLQSAYRRFLFDDFLLFMDRFVIDHQYGGFMCSTDYDGKRDNSNKLSWFEGRGAWVYAFLFNNLAREEQYLKVAHASIQLVLKSQPKSEDELWPKVLSRQGQPLTPPDVQVYGDLFIAEGLAEFSKASGEEKYWELAKTIVLKCVRIYDRPDYNPEIGKTYLGPNAPPYPGARIQGVWMVLIRVVSQMLEMRADAELEGIADRCVDAIISYHFNPEFELINELLNHDLTRPQNEYAQLVYTGHAIETLWMLLYEAARRKDKTLFNQFTQWFRRHVETSWDDVYGGVFRNLQNVNANVWLLDKVLWAQEEVLIGTMFIFEHTGEEWARQWFDKMYTYVLDKYPLKDHGSPLWKYASDRKVSFESFSQLPKRVENYHHPRHLMLNLLSLNRMIGRSGQKAKSSEGRE